MITLRSHTQFAGSARACKGFTLFELIVAVTIVTILVTVAVPGMRQIIDSNRLTAYLNSVVSGVHLARSEAIKRNENVDFCAGVDGCGGTWSNGWTVRDADGVVLASSANRYTNLTATAAPGLVSFDGEGLPSSQLEMDLSVKGIAGRRMTISTVGAVRSETLGDE